MIPDRCYNWFQNLLTFSVVVKHKTVSTLTSFNETDFSFDLRIHPVQWQTCLVIFTAKIPNGVPASNFSFFDHKISILIAWPVILEISLHCVCISVTLSYMDRKFKSLFLSVVMIISFSSGLPTQEKSIKKEYVVDTSQNIFALPFQKCYWWIRSSFVFEDHMLDWRSCQICYPLEIKLLLLLLLFLLLLSHQWPWG